MSLVSQPPSPRACRSGKVLPFCAVLMPVLCGMVGMVVDTGLLFAAHRQVQNAADAAAMAAALRLQQGASSQTAIDDASRFVTNYNNLSSATVTTSIPPTSGSHTNSGSYPNCVEVVVSNTVQTAFLKALGISSSTVSARAVAGVVPLDTIHLQSRDNGLIALSPTTSPGLLVGNGASLNVGGSVVVNAPGGGYDQYGQQISVSAAAVQTNGTGAISAIYLQSAGGASTPANLSDGSGGSPLMTSARTISDPLNSLPTLGPWNDSTISDWSTRISPGPITDTRTLNPGVYDDIKIQANANVTFNPGVYVISPTTTNQGLSISGNANVTGNGVMFYLTSSNYPLYNGTGTSDEITSNPWISGWYDWLDGTVDLNSGTQTLPSAPDPNYSSLKWAKLNIDVNGGTVNLTGLNNSSSPFNNVLFFQRRRIDSSQAGNMSQATFSMKNAGASSGLSVKGVGYAKWNLAQLGSGTYNTQLVVGTTQITDSSAVTITRPTSGTASWKKFGSITNASAQQVFLLE